MIAADYTKLQEALAFHGITQQTLSEELIQPLSSVQIENPALYGYLTRDPPGLEASKWDFVFSTGMTTEYPARRGWNGWLALREVLQNALDIEDKAYGYDKIKVDVYRDGLGVHVVDRGPGMPRNAWKLGGSDKECWERGRYGEGLKVAAAEFIREGATLYVWTRNQLYKAVTPPGSPLVLIAWGRANTEFPGTHVIIWNTGITFQPYEMIYQEYVKQLHPVVLHTARVQTESCPHPRPATIVDFPDRLFVADIYVNTFTQVTGGTPSVYSYNLWFVDLEPNRVSVSSQSSLANQVAAVYGPASIRKLLDRIIPSFPKSFEVNNANWYNANSATMAEVKKYFEEHEYSWTEQGEAKKWLEYMGAKNLVVPPRYANISGLFRYAPKAEDVVAALAAERANDANSTVVSKTQLDALEAGKVRAVELMYGELVGSFGLSKPTIRVSRSLGGNALGLTEGSTISLLRDVFAGSWDFMGTALHEFGHYYGNDRYGTAPDVSRSFEQALNQVMAASVRSLSEARFSMTVRRAMRGAWGAMMEFEGFNPYGGGLWEAAGDPYIWVIAGSKNLLHSADRLSDVDRVLKLMHPTDQDWKNYVVSTVLPDLQQHVRQQVTEGATAYIYSPGRDKYQTPKEGGYV